MGYYTRLSGTIDINPPLSWSKVKGSEYLPEQARHVGKSIMFVLDEEEVDTEEGTLTRRRAVGVCPVTNDEMKAYGVVDELQEVVNLAGPGHTFVGRIDCHGEGDGSNEPDVWRLRVVDGKAKRIKPVLVWPDDE